MFGTMPASHSRRSLLECGAALGAGKQVFCVAPHASWPFLKNHPRVRAFSTIEDAIVSLLAMAAGERQRLRRAA
jgi:hypothetical protein